MNTIGNSVLMAGLLLSCAGSPRSGSSVIVPVPVVVAVDPPLALITPLVPAQQTRSHRAHRVCVVTDVDGQVVGETDEDLSEITPLIDRATLAVDRVLDSGIDALAEDASRNTVGGDRTPPADAPSGG